MKHEDRFVTVHLEKTYHEEAMAFNLDVHCPTDTAHRMSMLKEMDIRDGTLNWIREHFFTNVPLPDSLVYDLLTDEVSSIAAEPVDIEF
jgi:hypothetical protein